MHFRSTLLKQMIQTVVFVVVLFAITWTWGLLVAPILMRRGDLGWFLAALLPSVWTPTLLAILFIAVTGGVRAIVHDLRRRLRWPETAWLLVAIVVPALATGIALTVARVAGDRTSFVPASALPLAITLQVITGALGEELGWRRFLLPRVANRYGKVRAIFVVALLWSAWHIPAFFIPEMPQSMMPKLPFLAVVAAFGIFLGVLFFRTHESVVATITGHLAFNVMFAIGGVRLGSSVFWGILAVLIALTSGTLVARVHGDTLKNVSRET